VLPEGREAIEKRAARVLRIRVPDAPKTARGQACVVLDLREHTVVHEQMNAPSELAREGLRVAEHARPLRRAADVREHDRTPQVVGSQEGHPATLARRLGFTHHERVPVLDEPDAPAVTMRSRVAAMPRELAERKVDRRRKPRRHREKLTHRVLWEPCARWWRTFSRATRL